MLPGVYGLGRPFCREEGYPARIGGSLIMGRAWTEAILPSEEGASIVVRGGNMAWSVGCGKHGCEHLLALRFTIMNMVHTAE